MRERRLFTDRDYLTTRAYATDELLAIRIATHQRYTVPPVDFQRWVLDLIPWQGDERVVDVGCGNGKYVQPVAERLVGTGCYLAGDLSVGMLRDLPHDSPAVNLDVSALPMSEGCCDTVLANHMLYHAPDLDRAVAECHRVLRPGGRLLAATNSQASMTELNVLLREGYDRLGVPLTTHPDRVYGDFSLENGQAVLVRQFGGVERHLLHSALVFPEPGPLLAYVNSMQDFFKADLPPGVAWTDLMQVWEEMVSDHIARHGAFRVGKVSGAFVAVKTHPI